MTHEERDHFRDRALALAKSGAPLSAAELAAIFRVGISQFYKNAKRGQYDRLRLKPAMGTKAYSGILTWRYLNDEPLYVPTFGKRAS